MNKKVWYKRLWFLIPFGMIILLALYLLVQGVRCGIAVKASQARLNSYNPKTAALSYGDITYVDAGDGEVIIPVHGIFGGYDQAFETCRDFSSAYRILAPSRFGYLGSDSKGDGTPGEQASAFVELMDFLGIEKAYILGTSAGGTIAIRFALDYPERTKGLILYCSAMPYAEKPVHFPEYAGPPPFLVNNFAMFALSPFFDPIMGMEPSTIYSMLPVTNRKEGVDMDARINNPDMARNFEDYTVENLHVPVLIIHAKDDKLADYTQTEKAVPRFPNCTFISFETGGHLMTGHSAEINAAVAAFLNK